MKRVSPFAVSLAMLCLVCALFSSCRSLPAAAETTAPARRPDTEAGKRISGRERRAERENRLLLRTTDDLRGLVSLVGKEIDELERETDAITFLESGVRETDFRDFIDWYLSYSDWLKEILAQFDDDLAQLSSGRTPVKGSWPKRYADMSANFKELEQQLEAMAGRFDSEGKRLAKIIDRRRLLQGKFGSLEERLARIEKKLAERPGKKEAEENDALRIRSEIRVVQNELLSLPDVDEDILMHYLNLGERARGEGDWLLAKSDEYAVLRDIAVFVSANGSRNNSEVEAALARVRRMYERQIGRLQRRIEALDRKRSRVTPAGSLRQVERSAELDAFYSDQKQRYDDYINRLKIELGAQEADLSELLER